MYNYPDSFQQLPFGSRNNPRQTWVMYLWQYIEQDATITYPRRRGNYVVNWGNAKYDTAPPIKGGAPFAHIGGNRSTPRVTKIKHVTNGTSPTDNNWRDIHNDDGVFRFTP